MLTITFARHGAYDFTDLTDEGRKKSQSLGQVIHAQDFDQISILSSPLPRALQTAELVAEGLGHLNVSPLESLRVDTSAVFERMSKENIAQISTQYMAQIETLPKESENIVVVTHEPNIIGFGLAFSNAVGKLYCNPMTAGAVSYNFNVDTWDSAMAHLKYNLQIDMGLVHRCKIRQLD